MTENKKLFRKITTIFTALTIFYVFNNWQEVKNAFVEGTKAGLVEGDSAFKPR